MQVQESISEFERYLRRRYPTSSTAKHYVSDVRVAFRHFGRVPRDVTRKEVGEFTGQQLAKGLAATTVNRRLSSLHHFFDFLADEADDDTWSNPVDWRLHRVAEPQRLPRDASEADVERLFAHIEHPRDELMFRLMYVAGLRAGEVAALCIDDFIPSNHPEGSRLRVRGKGDKERVVPLTAELAERWERYLSQRPPVEDDAVFITRRKRRITVRGIQDRLAHHAGQAGVSITSHRLRHTFGSRMAEGQMPLSSLSSMMGHAQVSTTQRYIAGAAVDVRADYQAAMSRLAAECPGSPLSPAASSQALEATLVPGQAETDGTATKRRGGETLEEPTDVNRLWDGLPDWLTESLTAYIHHCRGCWKPSQANHHTRARAYALRQAWRWLVEERDVTGFSSLRRTDLQAYVDSRLRAGRAATTINRELRDLWAFLRYVEGRGQTVVPGVFRVACLKQGQPLPRFLTESEYRRLERQILVRTTTGTYNDHVDRAIFYLLAHAGLRLGELLDLRVSDVDLTRKRLMVRQGKGRRDRAVPLSEPVVSTLGAYLRVRESVSTDHVFISKGQRIKGNLVQRRLKRYGNESQVHVSPHRLRHTLATRLVNVGMDIVSIQRLLGHQRITTTMVYARVHDKTVQDHFHRAMAKLEGEAATPGPATLFREPSSFPVTPSVCVSAPNCV